MKRILVTGGAGFVGSHLCEKLIAQGHRVISADMYLTGRTANLAPIARHPCFTALSHDICHPLTLDVDEIYNLACPASPVHYQQDPVRTTRACVLGTLNMLELARYTGARILQASTSEVYGDPTLFPQTEAYRGNVNPFGPRACYDEGKRCAESLFHDYHHQYGVEIRIARIFNTYGPRMHPDDGRVVSNFIVQALQGHPLTLYGQGQQTRAFCYVDDMVNGLIALMNHASALQTPTNLGNPQEMTVRELADMVLNLTGSTSPLTHSPLPTDDPARRCPDITRARQVLGWTPRVTLQQGLQNTIAYFRAELNLG